MRIEKIMEAPDKFYGAYNYYKKHLENDDQMTRTAKLAKVARMFLIPNFRAFERYVNEMENGSGSYY